MTSGTTVFKKKERLPWRTIENNTIIVDLDHEKVIDLDGVAKLIWDGIDGTDSIDDIVCRITGEYSVSREKALEDALIFAGELATRGLIHENLP